jgi:pyrroline-5-carboxylate reductase
VTSKGGTTERAIATMEAAGVKLSIVEGVKAAGAPCREMGDAFGVDASKD